MVYQIADEAGWSVEEYAAKPADPDIINDLLQSRLRVRTALPLQLCPNDGEFEP